MTDTLDIFQISDATGLSVARIRYVLDHRVLPGSELASKGHRVTRQFGGFEAFGLAVAGALLESGLRRMLAARVIETLTAETKGSRGEDRCPLLRAYNRDGDTKVQVGDGLNVRLVAGGGALSRGFDTGWVQAATGAKLHGAYEPLIVVAIDAGRLRDSIKACPPQ